MKNRKIAFTACLVLAVMTIAGSIQAQVMSVVDYRLDLWGTGNRTRTGRIAMKSAGPVVILGTFSPETFSQFYYTEDLSSWVVRSAGWMSGGTLDIAVDPSTNESHIVYGVYGQNITPTYSDGETGNRVSVGPTDNGVWGTGSGGQVQIAANNDGVTVVWHPRSNFGGGDNWTGEAHFSTSTDGGATWSAVTAATVLDHSGYMLNQKILASADELYYFCLQRDTDPNGGPFYQQVDDGVNNPTTLLTGLTTGYGSLDDGYGIRLSPAWNGSEMNLASVENNSGQTSGVVALYLDILGSLNEVVVFDDSDDHGGVATAEDVGLVCDENGLNYVFFVAEDPDLLGDPNVDTDLFVQLVQQDGTLLGSAQKLTDDTFDQYDPDVVYGDGSAYLVFTTQTDPLLGSDAGERVSYMEVTLVDPQNCEEALAVGYGSDSDLNKDCRVNIADFGIFAGDWLDCIDPCDVNCSPYPWE